MNVGLIGYGSIAVAHVRALRAIQAADARQELRLTWVMGRDRGSAERFALEHGVPGVTTELDEMLADARLDLVVVCSPSDVHAEQSARSLAAGKHVLCEIPLALSLAETDALIAQAAAADRRLMVCHTQRYYPPLIEARRRIATGELHPHAIVSRYMFHRRDRTNWVGRQRTWTDNLLWHHGCHAVDAALWLLGREAVDVVAQVALPGGDLDIPMDLTLSMRTERDQIATVSMSYNTHLPRHDYLVIGEEDTLEYVDGTLIGRAGVIVPKTTRNDGIDDPIARQDAEMLDAIRAGREPAVSAAAVRPAMAALDRAQVSLDSRLARLEPGARHPRLP